MIRLEIFDGTKTYMFPNGAIAKPDDIRREVAAVDVFPHVLFINGNVCESIQELQAMRGRYEIDPELSDNEAVALMQEIVNMPPPEPKPVPEERIAAALEFQNILMLPNEEV